MHKAKKLDAENGEGWEGKVGGNSGTDSANQANNLQIAAELEEEAFLGK